jgi:hypothetical protein
MANEIYHRSNWGNAVNDKYWADVYEKYSATNKMYVRSDYYENSNETDKLMADIYPKPSILLTPTAYDNGSLHSVKPVKTFGSELVTNGTFDTDSNWTKGTGWSISGSSANANNASGELSQSGINFDTGKSYKVQYTISGYLGSGGVQARFKGSVWNTGLLRQSDGTFTETILCTAENTIFTFITSSSFTGSIDNVSVKEVIDADFDFTRGSSATRVNEKGLIEDVQILSGNLVQNGDFSQIGSEEVTNGDFSQIGSELVTNGGFDTSSNWLFSGWSIQNGQALNTLSGAGHNLYQNSVTSVGKQFKVVIDTTITAGSVRIFLGGGTGGFNTIGEATTSGTFIYYGVSNGTDNRILLQTGSGKTVGSVSIDNVSVKEVGQGWTLVGDFQIDDTKAFISNASQYSQITSQQGVSFLSNGKTYKLEADITTSINNALAYRVQGGAVTPISTSDIVDGKYTAYFTMTQNGYFWFQTTGAYTGLNATIDNVSVKEVGQNWTFGTGASMGDGKVVVDGTGGNYDNIIYQDTNVSFANKKVKIKFDVLNYVSGKLRLSPGNSAVTTHVEANGSYEFIVDVNVGNDILYFINYQVPFVGSIDNVSVIEITDATNLPRINYTNFDYENGEVVPYSGTGSLLLEPQSTNLITYSEDFRSNSNFNSNAPNSIFESGYLAPDGSLTATRINGFDGYYVTLSNTGSGDARSMYVKSGNGQTGNVNLLDPNSYTHSLFEVTNEWKRVELVGNDSWFYIVDGRGASLTLDDVIVWGLQQEDLSYATSYIPTNGEVNGVTRLADVCINAGSSDLINSTEGCFYLEASKIEDDGVNTNITISDGTNNNRIIIGIGYQSKIEVNIIVGGSSQSSYATASYSVDNFNKIAFSYKLNEFKLFINGVNMYTDTNGLVFSPETLDELNIADGDGASSRFQGNVKTIAVFKEALDNDQLERLTGEGYESFNLLAQANNYTII